jgi:DsbC/DsbD-like thiol-disulfide interchange protein
MPGVKQITAAVIVLFGLMSSARAQQTPHIDATLVSDVASVAAGKQFKVGVHFKIDPGWHIYWINPGDSGLPTRLKLDLPTGYTAGDLEFPTPERIALPGNVVNYGYTDEVLLTVTVTPPATLAAGADVAIPVRATWLVCQDDCVPGSANLSITLPVGDGKPSPDADTFASWAKKVPVAADKSPDVSSVHADYSAPAATTDSADASVEIDWKNAAPTDVQFAPEPISGWDFASIKSETNGTKTVVHLQLKKAGKQPTPASFAGLILYKNPAGDPVGLKVGFGTAAVATPPAK